MVLGNIPVNFIFRQRILAATGISKNTLLRITKEGKEVERTDVPGTSTSFSTPHKKRPRKKRFKITPEISSEIKTVIYDFYNTEKRSPTLKGKYLREGLSRNILEKFV